MHLSGGGDADRPAIRRILPRRGGQSPQGRGQETPRDHGGRARKVHRGVRPHRLWRRAGQGVVRHHRALCRLCLPQGARIWLRVRRLSDRLPQGQFPRRVPGRVAHQRQGQPREGGRLPRRVPGHGHRGRGAGHQPLGVGLRAGGGEARRRGPECRPARPREREARHHLRAVGGAQRRRGARGPHRRRARGQRSVRRLLRLLPAGRPFRPQQAHDRVADQGGGLRQRRPQAQGPPHGVRADRRPHPCPAPGARHGDHDAVRRRRRCRCRRLRRLRAHGHPRPRVRQARPIGVREGDAGALRERSPPAGGRGCAFPRRRLLARRAGRPATTGTSRPWAAW